MLEIVSLFVHATILIQVIAVVVIPILFLLTDNEKLLVRFDYFGRNGYKKSLANQILTEPSKVRSSLNLKTSTDYGCVRQPPLSDLSGLFFDDSALIFKNPVRSLRVQLPIASIGNDGITINDFSSGDLITRARVRIRTVACFAWSVGFRYAMQCHHRNVMGYLSVDVESFS
jgi:hypothetical protein